MNEFHTVYSENGKSKYTVHTRPKMDWTEDADLHKQFKDWREEAELLLNTVLSHIRNQEPSSSLSVYGLERKQGPISTQWIRQKGQSKDYVGHTSRTGPNPNLMKLQHSHSSEP